LNYKRLNLYYSELKAAFGRTTMAQPLIVPDRRLHAEIIAECYYIKLIKAIKTSVSCVRPWYRLCTRLQAVRSQRHLASVGAHIGSWHVESSLTSGAACHCYAWIRLRQSTAAVAHVVAPGAVSSWY